MGRTVIHTNHDDLHVADSNHREQLRITLRKLAKAKGGNLVAFSKAAGHQHGWASHALNRTTWRMASLQEVIRACGLTPHFKINYVGQLPEPSEATLSTRETYEGSPKLATPANLDALSRLELIDVGRQLREQLGLEPHEVARRLTMAASKLIEWETSERDYYMMVTVQRYFRALGTPLEVQLIDPETGQPIELLPLPTATSDGYAQLAVGRPTTRQEEGGVNRLRKVHNDGEVLLYVAGEAAFTGLRVTDAEWAEFIASL